MVLALLENLAGAIAGEDFEIEQMYPSYLLVAKDQGNLMQYVHIIMR